MDPREFREFAMKLSQESEAVQLRTAINRSYYAAFNTAKQFLQAQGFAIPSTAQGHGQVREFFANGNDQDFRTAARQLGELYRLREEADYELGKTEPEQPASAAKALRLADNIIRAVDAHPNWPRPRRETALGAMRGWDNQGRPRR